MNFFQAQDDAHRRTKWLLVYFALAVLGVVGAIYAVVSVSQVWQTSGFEKEVNWWSFGRFLQVALPTVLVILAGTLWKSYQLSEGGAVVARDLGARPVDPRTTDTQERRLLNVVEEMAIASGMPTPQVWLMDRENGINAFAAGTEPANAVIGVTQGCLDQLTRSELQAVIAHEFSHILNGDMRLNMRLIGWLFGILLLVLIGRQLMYFLQHVRVGGRRDEKGNGAVVIGWVVALVLVVVGSIGAFFARLIQAAVSRQREFLADASAVQFTRDPDSVVSVLQKLKRGHKGLLESARASEASHLFFADAGLFSYGLATHPPLDVRIRAVSQGLYEVGPKEAFSSKEKVAVDHRIFGEESSVALKVGGRLRDRLDDSWIAACRDSEEAQSILIALLSETSSTGKSKRVKHWSAILASLKSSEKLALVDLAVPTLRQLSRPQYSDFIQRTQQLIVEDTKVSLFEFMLQRVLERHLVSYFEGSELPAIRYKRVSQVKHSVQVLLSALAGVGAGTDALRDAAYQSALVELGGEAVQWGGILAPHECGLKLLGEELENLNSASPVLKCSILQACAVAVMTDGVCLDSELEILRATADAIGAPLPPLR